MDDDVEADRSGSLTKEGLYEAEDGDREGDAKRGPASEGDERVPHPSEGYVGTRPSWEQELEPTEVKQDKNRSERRVQEEEEDGEVEVKSTDMDPAKVNEAIRVAKEALKVDKLEKAVAEALKKHFDMKYGVNWHCIVGQSFGSFVTHREGAFLYAYVGKYAILLYKT